jgi:hypothetical protein
MPHNSAYDSVVGYPGQGLDVTPKAGPGIGLVLGHITDVRGEPLDHVYVDPKWLSRRTEGLPDAAVYSDQQGFYMWDLPPGRFRITFNRPGYQPEVRDVEIREQEIITIDLQLKDPWDED